MLTNPLKSACINISATYLLKKYKTLVSSLHLNKTRKRMISFIISPCHIFQHRLCSHKALPWEEKIKFFESKHLGTRSLKGKPRCHCLFASFVISFVTYYAIFWDLEEMFKQSVSCDFLIEFKHSMPDWVCCDSELKRITAFIWLLLLLQMLTDVFDFY